MKLSLSFFFLVFFFAHAYSRDIPFSDSNTISKRPLDTSVFSNWQSVFNPVISNNGNYFSYIINNEPKSSYTSVIESLDGTWKLKVPGVNRISFSDDNRLAVFMSSADSLCLLNLNTHSAEYIPHVSSYQLFKQGTAEWLAIVLNTGNRELKLTNLTSGRELSYNSVLEYWINKTGNILVLKTKSANDQESLQWWDITQGIVKSAWTGTDVANVVFDASGSQIAFSVMNSSNSEARKSFWRFNPKEETSAKVADGSTSGLDEEMTLGTISGFSNDGERLFITIKEKENAKSKANGVKVNVWSHSDAKLQSQQLYELKASSVSPHMYHAILDLSGDKIIRLERDDENIRLFTDNVNDDFAIITKMAGDESEWYWNPASQPVFNLVSTRSGERKPLTIGYPYSLSPAGKYFIGRDSGGVYNRFRWNDLFSYNISNGQLVNTTKQLPVPINEKPAFGLEAIQHRGFNVAGWLDDDAGVILYDKYDIWLIDPAGQTAPINLTNGFGRKHHTIFRFPSFFLNTSVHRNQELILSAFDLQNKENGFYKIVLGNNNDPKLLSVGNWIYCTPGNLLHLSDFPPVRARDKEIYVVERENTQKSPNFFWTTDFKSFRSLSEVYPEKDYVWLASELVSFKTLNGKSEKGVLYKPDNFDPKKKYPLIIHYYEEMTDRLNQYLVPEAMGDFINIPWFVSHGYIVFTPDIHYTISATGKSAYNSIVGAAKFLSKFSYIDSSKIGIQGHSFGGYETNYIVTHTGIFAAAMASAGITDLISAHGSLWNQEFSKQGSVEYDQYRMKSSPWEKPELYVENSPIFRADKVTTPLLMMNNKNDGAVNFLSQGVSFFTALRRLGKNVWMLQYDGEDHSLLTGDAKLDFTIRITQFFDHYLKAEPAPKWMTKGISAGCKGIETGLELDLEGRCGENCSICNKQHSSILRRE